jgi:hypothetical protein
MPRLSGRHARESLERRDLVEPQICDAIRPWMAVEYLGFTQGYQIRIANIKPIPAGKHDPEGLEWMSIQEFSQCLKHDS